MYNMDMESIPLFEWHEPKRQSNLVQHGIDFEDAKAAIPAEPPNPVTTG
jgi:uncharacterized DUF497 family protein